LLSRRAHEGARLVLGAEGDRPRIRCRRFCYSSRESVSGSSRRSHPRERRRSRIQ
jgi:hypothetical protein